MVFKIVAFYAKCQEFIREFIYEPYNEIFSGIDFPYETELIIFSIF